MEQLFAAIVPGWRGEALPALLPAPQRLALRLSILVPQVLALLWRGRRFGALDEAARSALLERMATHPSGALRGLMQWWKLVALMTQESR